MMRVIGVDGAVAFIAVLLAIAIYELGRRARK